MDQNTLKTSTKQRVIMGVIAFLLLFSTIAIYALIVLNSKTEEQVSAENEARIAEIETEMIELNTKLEAISTSLSDKYFSEMSSYRSEVKPYNATTVTNAGLATTDLKEGTGSEIVEDSDYFAYYIGWCADESVFDSSFDDFSKPSKLKEPLQVTGNTGLIAGWTEGVVGMKVGGVREISMPGNLAYGESQEICGGTNSPLKFVVKIIEEPSKEYTDLSNEYNELYQEWYLLQLTQASSTNTSTSASE